MHINNSLNRLRLYKAAAKQAPRQADASTDSKQATPVNQDRRKRKDRRQRNIRVLLNRRCSHDRRNRRMADASEHKKKVQHNKINTRA